MFIRLLIYAIIGVLLYRTARSWFGRNSLDRSRGEAYPQGHVDDVMIKDPMCGAYFSRRKAVAWHGPEETILFCSAECRDRYLGTKA